MADPISFSSSTMAVAASALQAQQARMRVIAENIANADSSPTSPGGRPLPAPGRGCSSRQTSRKGPPA